MTMTLDISTHSKGGSGDTEPSLFYHTVVFDIGYSEAKEAIYWDIFKNSEELFWAARSKYQLHVEDVKEFKKGVSAYLESINYAGSTK